MMSQRDESSCTASDAGEEAKDQRTKSGAVTTTEPYILSEGIEISAQDERKYRSFVLPNEMQVCLSVCRARYIDKVSRWPQFRLVFSLTAPCAGWQVLLVSDPETDKSSAALDVGVGSLCDPKEVPGLAHFLEHMLFLGTEKYPDENSYSQFISAHGGRSNAYTALENTNYYFDITP